jgi:hypothetical protein
MARNYKVVVAAVGILLAVLGGLWGAWGPVMAMAEAGEVVWVTRLALVAGIGAVVAAASVMRGRVPTGSVLALVCGVVILAAGSAGAGIVVVLGATMVFGAGEEPQPADVREALRNVAS